MSEQRPWQLQARCRNEDPDMMQPDRATTAEVCEALTVCDGCPVRRQCRELAQSQVQAYGVHDGLWWGPEPVWEVEVVCGHGPCGQVVRTERDSQRKALFCSPRCRVADYRARSKVSA